MALTAKDLYLALIKHTSSFLCNHETIAFDFESKRVSIAERALLMIASSEAYVRRNIDGQRLFVRYEDWKPFAEFMYHKPISEEQENIWKERARALLNRSVMFKGKKLFLFSAITLGEEGFDLVVSEPIVFDAVDAFCDELLKNHGYQTKDQCKTTAQDAVSNVVVL